MYLRQLAPLFQFPETNESEVLDLGFPSFSFYTIRVQFFFGIYEVVAGGRELRIRVTCGILISLVGLRSFQINSGSSIPNEIS